MPTVNIHEAKAQLSRLIKAALEGEEVIIAKRGVPLVRLTVLASQRPERTLGFAKGLVAMADDFDAPLDDFASYQ